jgi:DNA-directed RNA polymerase specialized sigma24 family protein
MGASSFEDSTDESAFWREVLRISYSVAKNRFRMSHFDAEDIAQEMALRSLNQRRVAEVNGAWVHTGARFLCIDRLRSGEAERVMRERHAAEIWRLTDGATMPAPEASHYDLVAAIRSLSVDSQRLIEQYFWAGMSWEEIDQEVHGGRRKSHYRGRLCVSRIRKLLGRSRAHP